jgi:hypothetical protein
MIKFYYQKAVKQQWLLVLLFIFITAGASAQKIRTVGNKPRTGSSNNTFSVVKGEEIGIKMKIGKKVAEPQSLSFGAENMRADTLKFKVNIYAFEGDTVGKNYVEKEIIGAIPPGKSRVLVDLTSAGAKISGTVLTSIEWLKTQPGPEAIFSIGLFNGGTYHKSSASGEWKKIPVAGVDFGMKIKQ